VSTLRERLSRREQLLGSFNIELSGPAIPYALAQAQFDLLIVDSEHSSFGLREVAELVTACRAAGIASVVRVPDNSRSSITRVADLWPDGIMFPGVETEAEARSIVDAAKYAPLGQRGVCPMVRYSALPADERYEVLNERLALILQVEGERALEESPAIAAVPSVDALFIGTYDLSQSLGIPGRLDDPRVFEAGRRLRAALPARTALGVYVQTPGMARQWIDAGASLIAYATDGQLFLSACRAAAAAVLEPDPAV
jgi:4-hydroxy-2-oxoheptanedioate aldolase